MSSKVFEKLGADDTAEAFRHPMPVNEIHLHRGHYAYPVCPRCRTTPEREYQAYCDRCGQALDWKAFRRALVVLMD